MSFLIVWEIVAHYVRITFLNVVRIAGECQARGSDKVTGTAPFSLPASNVVIVNGRIVQSAMGFSSVV